MDPITQQTVLAAAGAGGGEKVYVDDVFSTFLYEGTGSTKTITNGIDLAGEGGLVWTKPRDDNATHALWDTERGATKWLRSQGTNSESTNSGLTSFNSDGFTLGSYAIPNQNTINYASWSFRKAPGFFDVVTYLGTSDTATGTRSIPHNLGSTPGLIILKSTSSGDWYVYHRSIGYEGFLQLNSTSEEYPYDNRWNQDPDANNFYVNATSGYNFNNQDETYVAYIFAHDDASFGTDGDESIIKCGSYTGAYTPINIDLGFEPQWVLIKQATGSSNTYSNWGIFDNMRGIHTGSNNPPLAPNLSHAEGDDPPGTSEFLEITPTGFIVDPGVERNAMVNINAAASYIYMAIRRPHKPPETATDVFAIDTGNSSSTTPCWDSGFPVDFAIMTYPTTTYPKQVATRLMGSKHLTANGTNGESNESDFTWDSNVGWGKAYASTFYSYMFKRAPGFFDVVTYSGNSTNRTLSHNLESTPEMVIVKCRSDVEHWRVYAAPLGATKALALNLNSEATTNSTYWNNTAPTSSVFSVGTDNEVNGSTKTYIAFLFATLSGISKVGSYTGTGNDINVDCGFTAGARFVLIKCNDYIFNPSVPTDWFVWDTTRGIVSGNDPYLRLNEEVAEVTNTDYIDPLNAGFTVTSSAPPALNTSGNTYTFLAIA